MTLPIYRSKTGKANNKINSRRGSVRNKKCIEVTVALCLVQYPCAPVCPCQLVLLSKSFWLTLTVKLQSINLSRFSSQSGMQPTAVVYLFSGFLEPFWFKNKEKVSLKKLSMKKTFFLPFKSSFQERKKTENTEGVQHVEWKKTARVKNVQSSGAFNHSPRRVLASPQLIYVTGSDLPRRDVLHYSCKRWTNDEGCYAANCTEENIRGEKNKRNMGSGSRISARSWSRTLKKISSSFCIETIIFHKALKKDKRLSHPRK